jgi:hypothetical protein
MPKNLEGEQGSWYSQSEMDALFAENRRIKEELQALPPNATKRISELENLIANHSSTIQTQKDTIGKLEGSLKGSEQRQKAIEVLLSHGLRQDRISLALRNLPEEHDFTDKDAAERAAGFMKDQIPEWFASQEVAATDTGTPKTEGIQRPPANGVTQSPSAPKSPSLERQYQEALEAGRVSEALALKNQMFGLSKD